MIIFKKYFGYTLLISGLLACIFFSCTSPRKIKKPTNIEEARKIVYDLSKQFPHLIDTTEKSDTNKKVEEVSNEKDLTLNPVYQQQLDTVLKYIYKDCPELKPQYKNIIKNNCDCAKELSEFKYDSAGYKLSFYKNDNGKLKVRWSVPKETDKINTVKTINAPCKEWTYWQHVKATIEVFLFAVLFALLFTFSLIFQLKGKKK